MDTIIRSSRRPSRPRRTRPASPAGDRPAQALSDPGRHPRPCHQGRARGRRSHAFRRQGRDAGRRRRIGLRQVDGGAVADPADQARSRQRRARRRSGRRAARHHGERAAPPGADGVPGLLRLAQSTPHHRRDHRLRAQGARHASRRRQGALARPAGQSRAGAEHLRRALSARTVGRPAPEGEHRARAGAPAAAGDPRRGGVGARQVGRGAGAEHAGRPQERARPDLSLYQPRSQRGAVSQRPRDGDVSRQDRRDRRCRGDLRQSAASLYARAAVGAAVDGSAPPHAGGTDPGRSAQPDRSAVRLPLSHALPLRRGCMRAPRAAARRCRPAGRRLPHARARLRPFEGSSGAA